MSKTLCRYLGTKTTLLGISKRFALNRSDLCRVLLSAAPWWMCCHRRSPDKSVSQLTPLNFTGIRFSVNICHPAKEKKKSLCTPAKTKSCLRLVYPILPDLFVSFSATFRNPLQWSQTWFLSEICLRLDTKDVNAFNCLFLSVVHF